MMDDIQVSGYTTKDVSGLDFALEFAVLIADHIGPVEVPIPRGRSEKWIPFEDLKESSLTRGHMTESFALRATCDESRMSARASFYWKKFATSREFEEFVAVAGLKQNSLNLIITPGAVPSAEALGKINKLIIAVAKLFEVNYLYAIDYKGCQFDRRFDTVSWLGIGLRDVYLVNYFGPAYASLIGVERLTRLPAEVIEQHGDSVLIAPLHNFVAYDLQEFERAREQVREGIGEQFFAAYREPLKSEGGCIFKLPFVLWQEARRFRDERGRAERRPVFDWSDMIEEE